MQKTYSYTFIIMLISFTENTGFNSRCGVIHQDNSAGYWLFIGIETCIVYVESW